MRALPLATAVLCLMFQLQAQAAPACSQDDVSATTTAAPPQKAGALKRISLSGHLVEKCAAVVVLGDSLALMWPRQMLFAAFPGKRVANIGVGGDTTENALWQLQQLPVPACSPELAVVFIGTNNLRRQNQPCATAAGISAVLEKVLRILRPKHLVYVAIPPKKERGGRFDSLRLASLKLLDAQPVEGVSMINVDSRLACQDQASCSLYRPDGLHLSPQGYAAIESLILAAAGDLAQ